MGGTSWDTLKLKFGLFPEVWGVARNGFLPLVRLISNLPHCNPRA